MLFYKLDNLRPNALFLREQLYISEWRLQSRYANTFILLVDLMADAYSLYHSRRNPFNPDRVPLEVWHEIFSYATNIEGFAFSRWDDKDTTNEWEISSLTRHSIPLYGMPQAPTFYTNTLYWNTRINFSSSIGCSVQQEPMELKKSTSDGYTPLNLLPSLQ